MANNPISFVDPDGGKAVMNDQAYAAMAKARREFKIWWGEHAKEFRHRGGDNVTNMGSYLGNALGGNVGVVGYGNSGGGNLFYHTMNLDLYGTSDFEKMDLNTRGIDGSIWSQDGWAGVIKEVIGTENSGGELQGAMIAEAALNSDNAKLLGWSNEMFKEYIKDGWTPNVYDREVGETKKESKDRIERENTIKSLQNGGDYIVDVNKGSALIAEGGDGDKARGVDLGTVFLHYKFAGGADYHVDLSKVDLSMISTDMFTHIGQEKNISIDLTSETGLIFGDIRFKYLGENKVKIVDAFPKGNSLSGNKYYDKFNFNWRFEGGSNLRSIFKNNLRNMFNTAGKSLYWFGPPGGTYFRFYFHGVGTIGKD